MVQRNEITQNLKRFYKLLSAGLIEVYIRTKIVIKLSFLHSQMWDVNDFDCFFFLGEPFKDKWKNSNKYFFYFWRYASEIWYTSVNWCSRLTFFQLIKTLKPENSGLKIFCKSWLAYMTSLAELLLHRCPWTIFILNDFLVLSVWRLRFLNTDQIKSNSPLRLKASF